MEEIWKDIPDFEGLYQVSNKGRIKSFRRWKRAGSPDEYILKPSLSSNGYYDVTLYGNKKRRKFLVHRLVAEAFIPNPDGLPHINHKDENPQNNNANNLEWCTPQYNNCYGTARFRASITSGKSVAQILINGQRIATYVSSTIAEQITGISKAQICACARGDCASAGGFMWEYIDF